MEAASFSSTLKQILHDLRAESLAVTALSVGVIGYIWILFVIWPVTGKLFPPSAWLGALSLLICTTSSYLLRHRYLHYAAPLFLLGVLVAISTVILAFSLLELAYPLMG
jgi:hypothetical protein